MPELPDKLNFLKRKSPEQKLIADARKQAQEALDLVENAPVQTVRKSFTCKEVPSLDELETIDPNKPDTYPEADLTIADLFDNRDTAIIRYYSDIYPDQPQHNDFGHVILVKQDDKIVRFAVKNGRRRDPLRSTKQKPLSLDKGKLLDSTLQPYLYHNDKEPAATYPNLRIPSYMFGMWLTAEPKNTLHIMSERDYATKKIDIIHGGTPEKGKQPLSPIRPLSPVGTTNSTPQPATQLLLHSSELISL